MPPWGGSCRRRSPSSSSAGPRWAVRGLAKHSHPPPGNARGSDRPTTRFSGSYKELRCSPPRGGLLSTLLEPLRTGGDPIQSLIELTRHGESPALGQDRAISIVASVLIPFAVAYAEHAEDSTLTDRAAMAWETLPAAAF